MSDQTLFSIFFSAMVVNNFTLAMFLGLCPFMGVSARVETALRMGLANIFVLVLTSTAAWFLNTYVLEKVPFLRIISFIIVVASLVQIVEMVVKKISPVLFRQLGIFLPLIGVVPRDRQIVDVVDDNSNGRGVGATVAVADGVLELLLTAEFRVRGEVEGSVAVDVQGAVLEGNRAADGAAVDRDFSAALGDEHRVGGQIIRYDYIIIGAGSSG